jgi:hypothetical protein
MYCDRTIARLLIRRSLGLLVALAVLFTSTNTHSANSDAASGPPPPNGCDNWVDATVEDLPENFPKERTGHSAVWTGQEMIIWGSAPTGRNRDDSWDGARFNPATREWRPINSVGGPQV